MQISRNDTVLVRVAVLLTAGSLFLYSLSLIQGSSYYSDGGPILPRGFWSYFGGVTLLGLASLVAWSVSRTPRAVLLVQWTLLVAILFLTPYLSTGVPRFRTGYLGYGYVEYILREGYLAPDRIWYHSWPGFSTLFSVVFRVIGTHSVEAALGLFPTISLFVWALPVSLIFRKALSVQRMIWVALWAYVLANWTDLNYFSPQAVGYFYFLMFVVLLLRTDATWRHRLLLVLVFIPLALTHLLTAWMTLATMAAFQLVWRRNRDLILPSLLILTISWTVYGVKGIVLADLPAIIRDNLSLDAFERLLWTGRFIETSHAREAVVRIRVAYTAIIVGLACLGAAAKMLKVGLSEVDRFLLISLGFTGALAMAIPYGGEILTRLLLFGLVPFSYFLSIFSGHRRFLATAAMLFPILVLLHLVAHYGGDAHEAVRTTEIVTSRFLLSHTERGEIIALPSPLAAVRQDSYPSNEGFALPDIYASREQASALFSPTNLDRPAKSGRARYVMLTPAFTSLFTYSVGAPEMVKKVKEGLSSSFTYDVIYSNGNSDIFVRE